MHIHVTNVQGGTLLLMSRKNTILLNILFLCSLYFLVALFFTIVYVALDILGLGSVRDHYSSSTHQEQHLDVFTRSLYFSFVTLFSVGYGDMTPLGLSKGVAIIEALMGYVLPYVIVLNYILFNPRFVRNINSKQKSSNKSSR